MTLSTTSSWFPVGERLLVPYHAPEGRRVNVIGAHFTHGPHAGRFEYHAWASLPKSRAKRRRKTDQEIAAAHGLTEDDVGPIDTQRVLTFIWRIAGRPAEETSGWTRERPLMIVLDKYSIHKSQTVADVRPDLEAANVHLVYLPAYCPELSAIEPVWNDVKRHHLPTRSFAQVRDLKRAVEGALARKAHQLQHAATKTTNIQRLAT